MLVHILLKQVQLQPVTPLYLFLLKEYLLIIQKNSIMDQC